MVRHLAGRRNVGGCGKVSEQGQRSVLASMGDIRKVQSAYRLFLVPGMGKTFVSDDAVHVILTSEWIRRARRSVDHGATTWAHRNFEPGKYPPNNDLMMAGRIGSETRRSVDSANRAGVLYVS